MTTPLPDQEPEAPEHELEFRHKEVGSRGSFMARANDRHAGTMTYSRLNDDTVIVDHTIVDDAFRGTGVGRALVAHLVEWARANHQSVIPLCPFTKAVLERKPEWQDIVHR
jgi:hypothetical protein